MFGSAEAEGMTSRNPLTDRPEQPHQPTKTAGVPGGASAVTVSVDHQPLFDDGKAPDALRTIGEVTRALSIAPHVLRYWEEQFPMLRPVKRSGGRRYYRPLDVALLAQIHQLVHAQGYTLRGARQYLEEQAKAPQAVAAPAPVEPRPLLPLLMDGPSPTPVLGLPQDDLLDALIGLRGDLARLLGED